MISPKVLLLVLASLLCFGSYSKADTNEYGVDCSVTPHLSSCSYENGQWYDGVPDQKNISDDGWVGIPLEFGFPFHGETFTYSWMHSNGVVSFLTTNGMPTIGGMCCNGIDLENNTNTYYGGLNYFIAPLWTDIINVNKDIDGDGIYDNGQFVESHTDENGNESQRYLWQNQSEFYNTQTNNTVGLEIFDTGQIDIHHVEVDIRNHSVFVGIVGDQSADEIETIDFYQYSTATDYSGSDDTSSSTPINTTDPCVANPLSSTSCSGYAEAYYSQQCTANPLYHAGCPGYADAYAEQQYEQQCAADPLYDSGCPGYETAYYNQQCEANPLYDQSCPGYETAYYDQQCTADPLYDSGCTGYETAYYNQQCEADPLYKDTCPGYEQAYVDNQCKIDPLYSVTCSGYQTAKAEQDRLKEEEEKAKEEEKEVVEIKIEDFEEPKKQETLELIEEQKPIVIAELDLGPAEEEEVVPSFLKDLVQETKKEEVEVVQLTEQEVSEIEVEMEIEKELEEAAEVEEETTEEESSGDAKEEESSEQDSVEEKTEEKEEPEKEAEEKEEKEEEKSEEEAEEEKSEEEKEDEKDEKKKMLIAKKASEAASALGSAATLEAQAELQNKLIALIGYNPQFNDYDTSIPQASFYEEKPLYGGQENVDTPAGRNLFNNDQMGQMISSQFEQT